VLRKGITFCGAQAPRGHVARGAPHTYDELWAGEFGVQ